MADISDVEQAAVEAVTTILYPAGPTQASIIGALCRIYRGWPNSSTLNSDLAAGFANITLGTDNESGRTTTRYLSKWENMPAPSGVAVGVNGQTVTISGVPASGDVVGVMIDDITFAYRVQTGDSPGLVAAHIAQLVLTTRIANLQGPTIKIPGARSITARAVCDSAASFESRRQEKDLRIICWCPTPPIRDAAASAIDAAINAMGFLTLSDASRVRILYRNTASYDQAQNALLYRRDLVYTVEYATITTALQPSMLFGASDLNSNITYG
jgi:hypothetical protein